MTVQPPSFTEIRYKTVDGENIRATKNNGVVTLVGDKNGVRQMPVSVFMEEFPKTLPQQPLVRSPETDTLTFEGKTEKAPEPKKKKGWLIALACIGATIGVGALLHKTNIGKNIREFVDNIVSSSGTYDNYVDDVLGFDDISRYSDDISRCSDDLSRVQDDFYEDTLNKGMYGQDIYDPLDPLNKSDILSPYYEDPLSKI